MPRPDNRKSTEMRPVKMTPGYIEYPEGSVLIEMGKTRVLCAVSVENQVPKWLVGQNQGWLTAEYAMLPRATHTRSQRETTPSARSQEIRRLIGRSLRAAVDLRLIGERTLNVDCDVLQADGGTRTAAITGAYVAVCIALDKMIQKKDASPRALKTAVAAVSVGIVNGEPVLDLNYAEDSRAQVDFNVVMTAEGNFVEVQGTGEGATFSRKQMEQLLGLAQKGIQQLLEIQQQTLDALKK
ncbi:MAG: ribonuclease PH [Chloroflexota bacterium]|nr:MAG: ribonuclease PH [Chloroflexota bacterium]